jgi:hypothetical protein
VLDNILVDSGRFSLRVLLFPCARANGMFDADGETIFSVESNGDYAVAHTRLG